MRSVKSNPSHRSVDQGRDLSDHLMDLYRRLFDAYGPQHWWPGDSPFEVIIGAILTQSIAWSNVEKAVAALKANGLLTPRDLRDSPLADLAALLYPTGYYNAKALKVKAFVEHMLLYQDDLNALFSKDISTLRSELISIHGVGEETADSIILYAAGKPTFVIDAYTRRIIDRLGLTPHAGTDTLNDAPRTIPYSAYRAMFQRHLPSNTSLFNEYHALLVVLGKEVCRKRQPACHRCPVRELCPTGSALHSSA